MRRGRFEPQHLGTRLHTEFLGDYELSAEEFASAIRVPYERVECVLAGRESIDADMALRLARLFGGSAEGWLAWQQGYDLWFAHEHIGAQLESIEPLDPDTRVSVREDEPLDPEFIEEIRRRMDEVDDPRRWLVVSTIDDGDIPLHEENISRMFYDVGHDGYCTDILGATPFKSKKIAEAVAASLGERTRVIEVTKADLEKPRRDQAVDRKLEERFFRNTGQGMSEWDVTTYLRNRADMAAYLKATVTEGDGELIDAAVADVMRAMTKCSSISP